MSMGTLLLLVSILFVFFYYFYQRNQYFKALNIPTPKSLLFLGHLAEFATVPFGLRIQQWTKELGSLYGIFEGGVPVLVTSDLDVCHDVFVKQYERFHSRKHFPLAKDPETDKWASMFTARGIRWKRLRTLSNPVFKNSNLRRLCPLITNACNDFMEIIEEKVKTSEPFNIMDNFQLFTCDIIARVAFGENRNMQRPEANPYYAFCKTFFPDKPQFTSNIVHLLPMVFPEIRMWFSNVYHFVTSRLKDDPWYSLQFQVTDLVEKRRARGPNENADFVDLFLETETESAEELNITSESIASEIKQLKIDKKILTEEIVGQLMLFLIAGYETTANSLSYLSYHLALDQERQEKLRNEVIGITGGATEITYEMAQQMRYMEQCIKEALRLYPLASFVQARTCMQSTTVGKEGNQIRVPAGLVVLVDAWSIQRNRQFWGEDADNFRPERFDEVDQTEINNYWLPFGQGPRICVGMRFAILEQKILLARILQTCTLKSCDKTSIPLELQGGITVNAKDVFLTVHRNV
ncbi:putative cytochrome P450 CYP13A8 [Aphelenchoides besseyi]|nr:putative cytochrome P450 CYP13A8 [Aphelenchoides besseyi]KAI6201788.1 putative cytochrome P450 CYP13A8 [Aphelenchoides besseyi]